MKNNFKMEWNNKAVYAILFINFLVILVGCLFKITHWKGASEIILLGLILQLFIWIYFLVDILKSSIHNKGFWIFFMFIFVPITQLVYVYRRDKIHQNIN